MRKILIRIKDKLIKVIEVSKRRRRHFYTCAKLVEDALGIRETQKLLVEKTLKFKRIIK